ncbi:MAG: zinc-binding dehydrogenase [Candidatus Omnitrophica bacterium]|nr:zinc-binding dehydrogenase [Candidatus Omnitrophota bacterium]
MKAAVLRVLGQPLGIEDLEPPPLSKGQVRVGMQLAAVCHSQKLEVSGGRGPDNFLPHLIGHEGVGVVEEVGPGVTKVARGDQVVLSWIRGSGLEAVRIVYTSGRGPVQAGHIATFCESPVVSEQCVTRIDPAVDPEIAVLAGCAIPTGVGTVLNARIADPNGAVCILGVGGVGLAAVCGARLAGWGQVAAADLRSSRLERARALGATHTLEVGAEDIEKKTARITAGRGFDLVIECAGARSSMELAVRLAKPKGGHVVIVGNLKSGETFQVNPMHLIQGRSLTGSWGGGVNPDVDIPRFVQLMGNGNVNHELLVGKRFSLEEVNHAIQALEEDPPGRPILHFEPNERSYRP